jgi:OOP family OmpA-OmpF porin
MIRACFISCVLCASVGCAGTVTVREANPDPDGDRVSGAADLCPEALEDIDGFDDADGCPEMDNDHDARLDADDTCPNDAEDLDRFEDADGCPELDNDGDRILDADDRCPCVPEVFNGHEDEDGCPDRGNVLLIDERILILDKVFFDRGSAVIPARYEPLVQAVAATLVAHAFLDHVQIAGHSTRDEPRSQALSAARATAVRDALIAAGVAPERLTAVGYAASRPFAPGRSRDANERNRRVEFDVSASSQTQAARHPVEPPVPVPNCPER